MKQSLQHLLNINMLDTYLNHFNFLYQHNFHYVMELFLHFNNKYIFI